MTSGDGLVRLHWPLAGHESVARQLLTAYDAPDRCYHDTRHLAEVLDRATVLLEHDPEADRFRAVVLLAAWFHDAVYDAAGDNEARSAELAVRVLETASLDRSMAEEVARLVRLTASHDPSDEDLAGQVLCDADLAILAAGKQRYAEYAAGVRREYAHVPAEDFARGRAAVLRRLVERPQLFHTTYGRAHWEDAARRNVAAELARLEG